MINIDLFPVTPKANKVDISYKIYEAEGHCEVTMNFYYDELFIGAEITTLTGEQLDWIVKSETEKADKFILERYGIVQLQSPKL